MAPRAVYYGAYHFNRSRHSLFVPFSHVLDWEAQGAGLAGDAAIDKMKHRTGYAGNESIWNEHTRGYLNPLHGKGKPTIWMPGAAY